MLSEVSSQEIQKISIERNLGGLRNKYEYKISDRKVKHIVDENEFFLSLCNEEEAFGTMSFVLENIKVDFAEEAKEIEEQIIEAEEAKEPAYDMNFREKEITIGLLLETIDGMQNYNDELHVEIEKFNSEDKARMAELEPKNEEYKAALVRLRNFVEKEAVQEGENDEQGIGGYSLLGRNGKILVLGASALDQNTMNGIAKLYGFHKKDFEYETDYTKVVNFAGRINNSERYAVIIF